MSGAEAVNRRGLLRSALGALGAALLPKPKGLTFKGVPVPFEEDLGALPRPPVSTSWCVPWRFSTNEMVWTSPEVEP